MPACSHWRTGSTRSTRDTLDPKLRERTQLAEVQTALGPTDTAELGNVLMHEHLVMLNPEIQANYPGQVKIWDEEANVADAILTLNELKAGGIDTLVDLTVVPMGRNVERVRRIAEGTPLTVIVATGLYTFGDLPPTLAHLGNGREPDPLIELFVRDISRGIANTGVRSAILKCATDEAGITPGTERVLRACAKAHRRTGVPITTHTNAATHGGLDQQEIFADEGVDLSRVIIGHCGDTTDIEYLELLIANGSYIGMDRFGLDFVLSFEDRVATVATMCERGHADRMVLSHDKSYFNDWASDEVLATLPNRHYLHITNDVLPALEERGVTPDQIKEMLVDNPRRIFETQGTY
jgi:phosphotriesterase-related protein